MILICILLMTSEFSTLLLNILIFLVSGGLFIPILQISVKVFTFFLLICGSAYAMGINSLLFYMLQIQLILKQQGLEQSLRAHFSWDNLWNKSFLSASL